MAHIYSFVLIIMRTSGGVGWRVLAGAIVFYLIDIVALQWLINTDYTDYY